MSAGVSKSEKAAEKGIPVQCESVGAGKRVSDGHSEHVNYTYRLSIGLRGVGTFVTRYSRSLQAHEQFVKQGLLPQLDPPLEFPPKYRLRNMTSDEGNVRLRQHELQLYFERLLGVSLCHVCSVGIASSHMMKVLERFCTCVCWAIVYRRRPACSQCQKSAIRLAYRKRLARNLSIYLTARDSLGVPWLDDV